MIRSSRTRLCLVGVATTALVGAVVVPLAVGPASADTEAVRGGLAAPSGLTPDDGAVFPQPVLKTVNLHWAAVADATAYRVQVGTDDTWSDVPTFTADTLSTTFTLPVWLPHASYVWRVAALRGSSVGHWTSETGLAQNGAQFTRGWRDAPTALSPAAGTAVAGRPTFRWTPVANASGYELQVSGSPDFPSPASSAPDTTPGPNTQTQTGVGTDSCFTARTQITPFTSQADKNRDSVGACSFTVLGDGTPRFWRVRPVDRYVGTAVDVDTTPASKGGISYLPPSQKPNNADISATCPTGNSSSATPSASASATATTTASASASPTSSASPSPTTVGNCELTHPAEAGRWSAVVPFSATYGGASGVYSPTNLVSTLSLASAPDGVCTVTAAGATAEKAACRDFPTLQWTAVPGATRYRLNIGLDDEFTNIAYIVESSALSFTPPESWRDSSPAASYYYALQACTSDECGAVTSTPRSFRKVSPLTVLDSSPAVTGPFVLSWKSYASRLAAGSGSAETQDAYAYHLQVATSDHPSFDQTLEDVTVDGTSYASPTVDYSNGQFIWRVQAVDSGSHRLPWSRSGSFLRDTIPPKIVSVTPRVWAAVTQPLKVVFSEPVTGVSASSLTLSPASGATVSVLNSTTVLIQPTKPMIPGSTYTILVRPEVKDLAGNPAVAAGPTFTVSPRVDNTSRAVAYTGAWRTSASSNAIGGTYAGSTPTPSAQRTATVVFRGTRISLIGCVGPSNGQVDVYLDGVRKGRVGTYRSYSGCGVEIAVLAAPRGLHTLKVVGIGSHEGSSKGNAIGLDAFLFTA